MLSISKEFTTRAVESSGNQFQTDSEQIWLSSVIIGRVLMHYFEFAVDNSNKFGSIFCSFSDASEILTLSLATPHEVTSGFTATGTLPHSSDLLVNFELPRI